MPRPLRPSFLVVAFLPLVMTSCVVSNHHFGDRDGAPDVAALEQARQERMARNDTGGLGDVTWIPLLTTNFEIYNVSNPPWPAGTGYAELDAYGPLFMFVDGDAFHYDENQELYERNIEQSYFWGLYRYERDDVRVPSGWRYNEQTSILFGLLRWPSRVYITDDDEAEANGDDTAKATDRAPEAGPGVRAG
tara:strand:- start:40242 stop:40814 length:573 start_codon:yes stop_codon:yes gene_type:complete